MTRGAPAREGERGRLQPRGTPRALPRAGSAARTPGQPLTLTEPLARLQLKDFLQAFLEREEQAQRAKSSRQRC